MTSQEQQLLDDFLQRLAGVQGVAKNSQADALIRQRLADQPDAQYLLVQRALLLERALDGAKAQIAQLQQQAARQADTDPSFLGGASATEPGFGRAPSQAYNPAPASYAMPQPVQPPAAPASWRDRFFGGGPAAPAPIAPVAPQAPSFLGSMATTAAGVAGGMFLFNGLENLVSGHHGGGIGSGLFGGGNTPTVVENVTTNNFIDDNGDRDNRSDRDSDYRSTSDDGSNWSAFDDAGDNSNSFDDDGTNFI